MTLKMAQLEDLISSLLKQHGYVPPLCTSTSFTGRSQKQIWIKSFELTLEQSLKIKNNQIC